MMKGIMCFIEELEWEVLVIEYKGLFWNVMEIEFLNVKKNNFFWNDVFVS